MTQKRSVPACDCGCWPHTRECTRRKTLVAQSAPRIVAECRTWEKHGDTPAHRNAPLLRNQRQADLCQSLGHDVREVRADKEE